MWFKITLAKDGAVRSCIEVSASFENSEHIVYIEADTRVQAIEKMRKQWKANYRQRVREERKSLGVCTECNEQAAPGGFTCKRHRGKSTKDASRATYEKRKELGLAPGVSLPKEHDARGRNLRTFPAGSNYGAQPNGLLNLRTLLMVQRSYDGMPAKKFAEWLESEIQRYREAQSKRGRAA